MNLAPSNGTGPTGSAVPPRHLICSAFGEDLELAVEATRNAWALQSESPGLLSCGIEASSLPRLVRARQFAPAALPVSEHSIKRWALRGLDGLPPALLVSKPWQLHVAPCYGNFREPRSGARAFHSALLATGPRPVRNVEAVSDVTGAGKNRCELIRAALVELLREKRRHLLRQLRPQPTPFTPEDSLVQLLLTSPTTGWLSVSVAPEPFRLRQWVSPFPCGEIPVAVDKAAPSRAFAKLVEAELRFGRRIAPGETCVDLGASPGGWTWVARQRGAQVIAVDRSPLRDDLMADPAVTFVRRDAFSYQPDRPVDWLVCDVIAAPERSIELVLEWVRRRWARHFVVTIKLREGDHPKLDRLKQELPALADDWYLTHLCANKHEACVFGSIRPEGSPAAESARA